MILKIVQNFHFFVWVGKDLINLFRFLFAEYDFSLKYVFSSTGMSASQNSAASVIRARIRVRVGGGVTVHNPHQAAVVGDHQVRIGVPFEEAGQLVKPVAHFAPDHHAAVGGEIVGQQNVGLAFVERRGEAHPERRNRKATLPFVVAANVVRARRVVELLLRRVDEHRFVSDFAIVQFRPRQLQAGRRGARRRVLDQQYRHSVWCDLADRRHHQAVAVRIDNLRIDPALVYVG